MPEWEICIYCGDKELSQVLEHLKAKEQTEEKKKTLKNGTKIIPFQTFPLNIHSLKRRE